MSAKAFAEEVLEYLSADGPQDWTPSARYDEDGDCVEVFLENGPFYAQVIDGNLDVYRDHGTDRVVGFLIKFVSRFGGKPEAPEGHTTSNMRAVHD